MMADASRLRQRTAIPAKYVVSLTLRLQPLILRLVGALLFGQISAWEAFPVVQQEEADMKRMHDFDGLDFLPSF